MSFGPVTRGVLENGVGPEFSDSHYIVVLGYDLTVDGLQWSLTLSDVVEDRAIVKVIHHDLDTAMRELDIAVLNCLATNQFFRKERIAA